MLLLGSMKTDGGVVDLSLLSAIDGRLSCPSMVWLLQQLPAAPHAKGRQIPGRFL